MRFFTEVSFGLGGVFNIRLSVSLNFSSSIFSGLSVMIVDRHRKSFQLEPMLTDRQLWALGMIVAQWSILEKLMDQHAKPLFDEATLEIYNGTRSFAERRRLWLRSIKTMMREPHRSRYVEFVAKIAALQDLRDMYVHGIYGGNNEPHQDYRHAGFVKNLSHVKGPGRTKPTQFSVMNKVARDISEISMLILFTEKALIEQSGASSLGDALRHICE